MSENYSATYSDGLITVVDDYSGKKAFITNHEEDYYAYGDDDLDAVSNLLRETHEDRNHFRELLIKDIEKQSSEPDEKQRGRFEWVGERFILEKNDRRYPEFVAEKKITGIMQDELWNLDYTFSLFILPRLKAFRKNLLGYPNDLTQESWEEMLDKMIWSFQQVADGNDYDNYEEEWANRLREGFKLFGEYYLALWS